MRVGFSSGGICRVIVLSNKHIGRVSAFVLCGEMLRAIATLLRNTSLWRAVQKSRHHESQSSRTA